MLRLVLCHECVEQLADENSPLYLAMLGPQGATLDEECFLICGETKGIPSWYRSTHELKAVLCDGKCGKKLMVSKSSEWFMEQREQLQPQRFH